MASKDETIERFIECVLLTNGESSEGSYYEIAEDAKKKTIRLTKWPHIYFKIR